MRNAWDELDKDTEYVVLNEHTLGYFRNGNRSTMGILHASVLKGSPFDPFSGPVPVGHADTVRKATLADFREYRVEPPRKLMNRIEAMKAANG